MLYRAYALSYRSEKKRDWRLNMIFLGFPTYIFKANQN